MPARTLKKQDFYDLHNAVRNTDEDATYLDDVECHDAETVRAKREDREPDYDNPGSTAGTPVVSAAALLNILGIPPEAENVSDPISLPVDTTKPDDNQFASGSVEAKESTTTTAASTK